MTLADNHSGGRKQVAKRTLDTITEKYTGVLEICKEQLSLTAGLLA
ncbi:MAG: hypothetical protein ACOX4Q_04490 [Syntrophomonadales bacterium]|jgi:hypothetical protein